MLYIKTDSEDRNWLNYLLEEFKRINQAEFKIQVVGLNEKIDSKNIIYYTKLFKQGINFPNRSYVQPNGRIKYLSKDIFISAGTETFDHNFVLKYDLFWNAFIFLSRLEEYLGKGKRTHSYSSRHRRKDKATFAIPIVNNLFDELGKIIKSHFPDLLFGAKQKPMIELSHDIDYINKTPQLRLRRLAFNLYQALKSAHRPVRFFRKGREAFNFAFLNTSHWCFDYWEELEKKANRRSVFYVYVKTKKRKPRSWLIDPSYDLKIDTQLLNKLQHLKKEGFEIGLHGSFESAVNETLLTKEKEILEELMQDKIVKVRQHWLRYDEKVTPYLHEQLFKFDSTLGWNDRIGFRSGCASVFRPYDHKNKRAFNFFEIPQVIMDANIFDYSANPEDKNYLSLLKALEGVKNATVAVNWHQNSSSSDYGWNKAYEKIINYVSY